MINTRSVGREGENLAIQYLKKKGYHIVRRNYLKGTGEIDIIAGFGQTLVFCEVKYWRTLGLESIEQAISPAKKKRIIQTSKVFLSEYSKYDDFSIRYDIILIAGQNRSIYHIERAFSET